MTDILPEEETNQHIYAAIDLGSNSFHMIIAREVHGQIQVIDKHKEMVRLRSGLDKKGYLTESAFETGIECLQRFGQLIKNIPGSQIRAVGTNTLRNAKNSPKFLRQASLALGHEIQIIAGQEEARLIYLGVAHDLPHNEETRLVMDIGGGSTEYIIGKQFSYQHLTSTEMGCVSITQRFFSKPEITEKRFNKAISTCQQILRPHKMKLRHYDWDIAIGASGTIKSVGSILEENSWSQGAITLDGLNQLKQALIEAGTLDNVSIAGLKEERLPVLTGGLAILIASFEVLNIEQLNISNNALREGLVFDTLGRLHAEDVRETSVKSVQAWLKIDSSQADAVADTSDRLYKQAHNSWQLHDIDHDFKKLLNWAARLHEAGMALSYKRYRHHSAYLIENAELAGFTQQEKQMLSALLVNHRGKFIAGAYDRFDSVHREKLLGLTVLLRLAVRIHRGREIDIPTILLIIESERTIRLEFENDWLKTHPLTQMDLEVEAHHLSAAGFQLSYS
ncbi:exopolyphosphatase [Hydrogenovibrio sp. SC-1]|uniref:exopolyphosphatase n=1 Tax=Hydrogenovibrio sp. SC-1 TaxID=2065820 RepID=UPI000C7C87DD|nr:exopolyphosphatase [Hydrogenovibrio sp. SC-1]PLA74264.1 exopolyphosphatase [Hydrogenovibrio sp. SC-1]